MTGIPSPTHLMLCALAAVVLVSIPGPNLIYITTRSLGEGRRAGVASALGVETATLIHVSLASVGLSAVVAASPVAFTAVRYAGAAYLLFLAVRTLRTRDSDAAGTDQQPQPLRKVFLQGLLVNLLNPKVILFFLALLPQFVDRSAGGVPLQMAILGCMVGAIGLCNDLLYAVGAGMLGDRLRAGDRTRRRRRRITALIYAGLGAVTALSR